MDLIDDSFDDILATMELPVSSSKVQQSSSAQVVPTIVPQPKQVLDSVKPAQAANAMKPTSSNAVQVHPNQRGNPILKSITNIPWEFNSDIVPDYVVGKTACILFLSIQYHNLKPDYIHERLKQLGKKYELRILLVHVDIKDPQNALKHLTRVCLLADLTLMLAWSPEEAGKIIETYKMFEHRNPELIMEKTESDHYQKVRLNPCRILKRVHILMSTFFTFSGRQRFDKHKVCQQN